MVLPGMEPRLARRRVWGGVGCCMALWVCLMVLYMHTARCSLCCTTVRRMVPLPRSTLRQVGPEPLESWTVGLRC